MTVKTQRKKIIEQNRRSNNDTGSAEVQIALLTDRIKGLTEHFKKYVKDHSGRRGLIGLVNRRRKLLTYLKGVDEKRYQKIVSALELRK